MEGESLQALLVMADSIGTTALLLLAIVYLSKALEKKDATLDDVNKWFRAELERCRKLGEHAEEEAHPKKYG